MAAATKTSHFKLCDDQPLQEAGAVGYYLDGMGEDRTPVTFMSLAVWETLGRPDEMSFQAQVALSDE